MKSEIADLSTEPYFPSASEYLVTTPPSATHGDVPWLVSSVKSLEAETGTKDLRLHSRLSPWCASIWKRAFDLTCIVPALILISPILGIIAIVVRLTSPGPVIFRQQRSGRYRKLFTIYKFRTMEPLAKFPAAASALVARLISLDLRGKKSLLHR